MSSEVTEHVTEHVWAIRCVEHGKEFWLPHGMSNITPNVKTVSDWTERYMTTSRVQAMSKLWQCRDVERWNPSKEWSLVRIKRVRRERVRRARGAS